MASQGNTGWTKYFAERAAAKFSEWAAREGFTNTNLDYLVGIWIGRRGQGFQDGRPEEAINSLAQVYYAALAAGLDVTPILSPPLLRAVKVFGAP